MEAGGDASPTDETLVDGQCFTSMLGSGSWLWLRLVLRWRCSSSRRPPQTLIACFQTCPQAEGPQLQHPKQAVLQQELQPGLG